ncbi:MAG: MarR family transcriptional regulator [Catenulispora sp.]|nr:MarR family transcriptional regulator [Catenulispora sp.]
MGHDAVGDDAETVTGDGGGALNLGLLCFIAFRALETRVFEALAEAGYEDLTVAQGRIAARIGPDGARITELAEAAQVTKQTAGFLVDQLEKSGYVRRVPDPADGRARLVRFTERGEGVIAVARRVEVEVEAEWTKHLGKRGAEQLRTQLTRLREITDPYQ